MGIWYIPYIRYILFIPWWGVGGMGGAFLITYTHIRVRGSPERDILSLRTLGLGLARFGRPSAGAARPNWLILKSEVSEKRKKKKKSVSVCEGNLIPYF